MLDPAAGHADFVESVYGSVAARPTIMGRHVGQLLTTWLEVNAAQFNGKKIIFNMSFSYANNDTVLSRNFHTARGSNDWIAVASGGNGTGLNTVKSIQESDAPRGYFVVVVGAQFVGTEFARTIDGYTHGLFVSHRCGEIAQAYCVAAPIFTPSRYIGTSGVVAQVSAVLDTVWAVFPSLSAPQLTGILFSCAQKLDGVIDDGLGQGIVDLGCMLTPNGELVALNTLLSVRGSLAVPQTLVGQSWGKAGDGTGREWDINPAVLDAGGRYFASIHPYELQVNKNVSLGIADDRLAVRADYGHLSFELSSEQGSFRGMSGTEDFAVRKGEAVGVGLHRQWRSWRFSAMAYSGKARTATQSLALSGEWVQFAASYTGTHQHFSLVLDSGTRLNLRIGAQTRKVQLDPALSLRYRLTF